ncbi:MAG: ATP/GTP-binding protein [Pyrinomonadaceae bacterium]
MIRSIKIENFRCYENVHLQGLQRINIVVGENGSGKTALFEAMFFLGGLSNEVYMRLKSWRLMPDVRIGATRETLQELFGDYFRDFNMDRAIYLETKGSTAETRSVRIYFEDSNVTEIPIGEIADPVVTVPPLHFKGKYDGSKTFHEKATLADQKLSLPQFPSPVKAAFFPSGTKVHAKEAADQFSDLEAKGQLDEVLSILTSIYPFVSDLSIVTRDGKGMVWARVNNSKQKQPVTLISEGVNKLLGLLLYIKSYPYSHVLIDEIENGFYYKKMPDIWRALYELAFKCNVQIFVSTHSLECLRAAKNVLRGHTEEFHVLRTVRSDKGEYNIREIGGDWLLNAIESDLEIR